MNAKKLGILKFIKDFRIFSCKIIDDEMIRETIFGDMQGNVFVGYDTLIMGEPTSVRCRAFDGNNDEFEDYLLEAKEAAMQVFFDEENLQLRFINLLN